MESQSPSYSYVGLLDSFSEPSVPLLNGAVAHRMYYAQDSSKREVIRQLIAENHLVRENDSVGYRKVANAAFRLMTEIKNIRRLGINSWNRLVEVMYSPFYVQPLEVEEVLSTSMETELLGERVVIGGNESVVAGASVENDLPEDLVTEEVSTEEVSLSTTVEDNLNQGFFTVDVSIGAGPSSSDVYHESFSTALAHMNEHNYSAGGHHGIEISAASEESSSVQVKSGYDLRGKRCSRCVIKNQTILHYKNVIKKLKSDLKAIKSLKVKNLTRLLQRKHAQAQEWKKKYMQEKEKKKLQASGSVGAQQVGMGMRGKELMIARVKLTKLQRKFQIVTQQHQQDIDDLRSKLRSETSKFMEGQDRLVAENSKLLKEMDALVKEKKKIEAKQVILEAENRKLMEEYEELVDTKQDEVGADKGKYDFKVRKVTYKSLLYNVPVRNVGQLAEYIAEAVGEDALKMPHYSSISKMAHEPGVLALIQVGEALQNLPATEASDGATMEPATEDYVISTARVASGRAVDYAGHIISSMKEVASVYSDYTGLPFVEVLSMFKDKCTCSVTDRAAVNTCVLEMLQSELDMQHTYTR
ncbi:uncharacterized protein LOC131931240 [Physella acuta]|uniref:uncharacterized protein LOC131931240 n=1 Tax=Physella acuta TaxID=109671 RepID=UPI0027DCAE5B|nr:uncharacterized protein LOC131931240 [Physella acuta]